MTLRCAYCNVAKERSDFPVGHYAECWTCYEARREKEIAEMAHLKRWWWVVPIAVVAMWCAMNWLFHPCLSG